VTVHRPAGAEKSALILCDVLGHEVRRYPAPSRTTDAETLDLRGLPAGLYVLRSGTLSQKLVVE